MTKLDQILGFASEHRLKDNILVLLCSWSVLVGIAMFFDQTTLASAESFSAAFYLAQPVAWGLMFFAAGVVPIFTFRQPRDHRSTAWMLRLVAILYASFSILAVISNITDGGVLLTVVGFLLPAALAGLLAAVYDASWRRNA